MKVYNFLSQEVVHEFETKEEIKDTVREIFFYVPKKREYKLGAYLLTNDEYRLEIRKGRDVQLVMHPDDDVLFIYDFEVLTHLSQIYMDAKDKFEKGYFEEKPKGKPIPVGITKEKVRKSLKQWCKSLW